MWNEKNRKINIGLCMICNKWVYIADYSEQIGQLRKAFVLLKRHGLSKGSKCSIETNKVDSNTHLNSVEFIENRDSHNTQYAVTSTKHRNTIRY